MKQILISLFILTSSFSTHALSVENKEPGILASDSLEFVHTKRNEKVTVKEGMNLDILTHDKEKIMGEFKRASKDSIMLKQRGNTIAIAITNIKHVTVYPHSNVMNSVLGIAVGGASATSLTLGGAALIGGIATLGNSVVLGVGLLGISVPLIYYGLDLYFMLKKAGRRKIKLNKGWRVLTPGSGQ
ncbi:MAG: hypothetical protein ABJE80_14135 [Reichenbachiella sp.]|uniref:hypothetical protein n=1 Tax=Reichenbachiella sp. TaxID=2184521 RepID=UPI00326402FD